MVRSSWNDACLSTDDIYSVNNCTMTSIATLYGEPIKTLKINVGCGRDYRKGWWNTDVSDQVLVDQRMDIGTGSLDVPDDAAGLVYISGVLEQIGPNEQLVHALNECWRVLGPGGQTVIVVPNAKYAIAHRDPMDIRKFTPDTFRYFLEGAQEYRDYGSVYGFKPWRSLDIQENERHILTVTMIK